LDEYTTKDEGRERLAAAVVARLDDIVARTTAHAVSIPGYSGIDPEPGRRELSRLLPALIRAVIVDREAPSERVLRLGRPGFEERARLGVPLSSRYRLLQYIISEILTAINAAVRDLALPATIASESSDLVMHWTGAIMAEEAEVYRDVELEHARSAEAQRVAFVADVLAGSLTAPALRERAAVFGIAVDRGYVPFRAIPIGDAHMADLERAVHTEAETAGVPYVTARVGGELSGVVGTRPAFQDVDIVAGVGPQALLSNVAPSWQLAGRAFETARAFGLRGVWSLEELGLRAPVLSETYLATRLVARFLEPLDALGPFGRVLEDTVRAFFDHGLRFDATARALYVHTNTLRHRLMVFQRTTGADLRRTEDIVKVWWALASCDATEADRRRS
jgi:putative transposase